MSTRVFRLAGDVVGRVLRREGSARSLLYSPLVPKRLLTVVYALVTETLKHATAIERLIAKHSAASDDDAEALQEWKGMVMVLVAEIAVRGREVKGNHAALDWVERRKEAILRDAEKLIGKTPQQVDLLPRYTHR